MTYFTPTKNSFPPTIDFEYEVKGVSGYDVFVGVHDSCNLSQEIFSPNYPPLSINTATLNLSDLLSNDSFNAYIICGGGNLSHYESGVKDLLNKGKGFILVRNFNSAPDLLTKEIFQIDYSGGGSSTDSITFYNLSHPNSGRIAKRFINNIVRINTSGGSGQLHLRSNDYLVNVSSSCVNISGSGCGCLLEGDSCNFSGMIVRIYQIDPGLNWFDIKLSSSAANPRDYSFADDVPFTVNSNNHTVLSPASNSGKSLLNIQVLEEYSKSYETAPRAFWIYDFNKTRDDLKLLFRTGLIWVAGEHSLIFNKNIPEESTYCMHYYSGINGNNIPYIVKLHYWGY
ncbi:MAG: hypothetical protein B6D55_06080 [Candidatus Omnitrophica bacterium 4484_70.2]|nr:MAG: hypothetical protein B6D55_06080 [Candidatus Omnitrophica bacterium 4484_70.2]